ncbi:MAG: D-glycerate dehydrogenase [Dehalococcoidia bacterium]|nr:D-glycerate dehydrogenase [Dehalococcoidia bacterium]
MTKPVVYVTREVFPEALELLRRAGEVRVWEGEGPPPYETLARETEEATGLFCLLTDRVDAGLLACATKLRVAAVMAVGHNNIDVAAATAQGVYVGNTPGVLTETTADLAMALLLARARRIPEAQAFARAGRWRTWSPMELLGTDVHGATLGIVGMGRIGEAVARRARGFGMRVVYHSRTRKAAGEQELGVEWAGSLGAVLEGSDFVSLHVPLTGETRGMIGEGELRRMRRTAALVNTSRGEVVDQAALRRALREGWIAGAALDVTDPEPMTPDDPLLGMANVVVLPHVGSATRATRLRMAMMTAQNIVDVLEGRAPAHCVNAQVVPKARG